MNVLITQKNVLQKKLQIQSYSFRSSNIFKIGQILHDMQRFLLNKTVPILCVLVLSVLCVEFLVEVIEVLVNYLYTEV